MATSPETRPYRDLLAEARKARRMTRLDLASRVGLDPSHLYRVEKGQRGTPRRSTVLDLARALGLDPAETRAHLRAAGYDPELSLPGSPPLDKATSPGATASAGAAAPETGLRGRPTVRTRGSVRPAADAPTRSGGADRATPYVEAVLDALAVALSELPPASLGPAIATLSSFASTLASLGTAEAPGQPRSVDASSPAGRAAPGPIAVGCIPIAGWQWKSNHPAVIAERIERAAGEALRAGVRKLAIVLPARRLGLMRELLAPRVFIRAVDVRYVSQAAPLGVGHAILQARPAVGDRPFAVILPDDRFIHETDAGTVLERLVELDRGQAGATCLLALTTALVQRKPQGVARVGEAAGSDGLYRIERLAEGPAPEHPIFCGVSGQTRTFHIIGRYLLPPTIFDALAALDEARRPRERLELTDAVQWLLERRLATVLGFELPLTRIHVSEDSYVLTAPADRSATDQPLDSTV